MDYSKIVLVGDNEDIGIGIVGQTAINSDLRANKKEYEKLYKKKLRMKKKGKLKKFWKSWLNKRHKLV